MASWQFDLHLLPRDSVLREFSEIPDVIDEELWTEGNLWANSNTNIEALRRSFSDTLPKTMSWSDSIEKWGDEDGNRIDLVLNEEGIADIYVRIDLRQPAREFIASILEIARSFNFLLLTDDTQVMIPDATTVMTAIQASSAARFVKDPAKFLDDLV